MFIVARQNRENSHGYTSYLASSGSRVCIFPVTGAASGGSSFRTLVEVALANVIASIGAGIVRPLPPTGPEDDGSDGSLLRRASGLC